MKLGDEGRGGEKSWQSRRGTYRASSYSHQQHSLLTQLGHPSSQLEVLLLAPELPVRQLHPYRLDPRKRRFDWCGETRVDRVGVEDGLEGGEDWGGRCGEL